MFAVYRISKTSPELNYSICSEWFHALADAIDDAQRRYEEDPCGHRYEVRDRLGRVRTGRNLS